MSGLAKKARSMEPTAVELIEEAVHLLRRAPAGTLAIYLGGAGAWVLGFLFFWAHTTWFAPQPAQLAWSALGLVGLFVGLKVSQAEFCARLLAQRLGEAPAVWTWRRGARLAVAQVSVQAWGCVLLPLAALATVPFGWVYGYYQHATVIGDGDALTVEAREHTRRWAKQNHLALLFFSFLALVVWVNIGTVFYAIPWLANRMLGIENVFGMNGWWFLNTTFLASVSALTWLALDPLFKAFYVLRVFHGRAQRSGEDLRVELRGARREGSRGLAGVTVCVLAMATFFVSPLPVRAAGPVAASASGAVDAGALDRALDDVLKRRDFQWQLRPQIRETAADEKEAGAVTTFLREGVELVREFFRSIERTWESFRNWLKDVFGADKKEARNKPAEAGGGGTGALRMFLYVLIGALVLAIVVVIFLMVRHSRRQAGPVLVGRAISLAQPDLRDEQTHAAQMPADGWLALAREQRAKGEWRLALRALYLATLARHAADGLLSLAKFKTNLDYERELRRRAVLQPDVPGRFSARRVDFESVWYGRAEAGEQTVSAWLGELEKAEQKP